MEINYRRWVNGINSFWITHMTYYKSYYCYPDSYYYHFTAQRYEYFVFYGREDHRYTRVAQVHEK